MELSCKRVCEFEAEFSNENSIDNMDDIVYNDSQIKVSSTGCSNIMVGFFFILQTSILHNEPVFSLGPIS